MGEWIAAEYKKTCATCEVEFVSTGENTGLLGELRRDKRRGKNHFDMVLGLEGHNYQAALADKLVQAGWVFNESPFTIIVNRKLWGKAPLPTTWQEVPKAFAKKLLVQDPRLSQVGVGWLRSIFEAKLMSLADAKRVEQRVFPSWSSAYAAFAKEQGVAVWTFKSSEAYHRCHQEKDFVSVELKEGYPLHQEWLAVVAGAKASVEERNRFDKFMQSAAVQSAIPQKNWMFPGVRGTPLPDCFREISRTSPSLSPQALPLKTLQKWTDEWSL